MSIPLLLLFWFPRFAESAVGNQVGNEFSSVEALWSQFENVMAKEEDAGKQAEQPKPQQPEGGRAPES